MLALALVSARSSHGEMPCVRVPRRLVEEYSAVMAIVVTTTRKALTLFASFLLFPKHLGISHPIGAALVFGSAFVTLKRPPKRMASRATALPV